MNRLEELEFILK